MTRDIRAPSRGDAVVMVVLLTLAQLTTWLQLDSADAFAGPRLANSLLVAVGTVPVLWRRSAPTAVLVLSASALCLPQTAVALDVTVLGQFVPLVVATASCGYHASRGRAVGGAAFAAACLLALSWSTPVLRTPTSLVFNVVVLLSPWAAARALRHREERARRLGAALAHERADFEARMAEAVDRQRTAIARDLHDVVAHAVSIMVVQIGGARLQLGHDPDRASRSLLHAEDAGRQALTDLRQVLAVLRSAAGATTPPASSPATAHPRPGLRQLAALAEQAEQASVQVELLVDGDLDALPPAVDVTAYRIAQEAITNVVRHSAARRARVQVELSDRLLSMTVHDSGPATQGDDASGFGLVGIRERVAFLGGHARVGPDGSGGWEVAVEIPLGDTVSSCGPSLQRDRS